MMTTHDLYLWTVRDLVDPTEEQLVRRACKVGFFERYGSERQKLCRQRRRALSPPDLRRWLGAAEAQGLIEKIEDAPTPRWKLTGAGSEHLLSVGVGAGRR